jgi:hypothetical protein
MALINKSLGNLYRAVSGSSRPGAVSIGGLAGGGSNVSFSSFSFDSASVTLPFKYIVENTTENVVFSFTSAGTLFNSKVKDVSNNYNFVLSPNDGAITFGTNAGGNDGVKAATTKIAVTNISNGVYAGNAAYTLAVTYNDGGWSQNQSGFNSTVGKTIYTVDSYNSINSDVLCVDINTLILLSNGNEVNAEDLYIGDVIKTYVPTDMPEWLPENDTENWYWWYQTGSSGEIVDASITNIYYSFVDSYISINNDLLKCTHAHPLFILDIQTNTYQFVRAEDIEVGDKLVKYNKTTSQLEEIDVIDIESINETLEIATITVDTAHTYLSNGFVSHNKGSNTAVPIPSNGLVCYLDAERTQSYSTQGQTVFNDIAGYSTGFNVLGASIAGVLAPTFTNTSPKYLTFSSNNRYGVKLTANASGTGNSYFNTTTAGFTIFTFIRGIGNTTANSPFPEGSILRKGNDWEFYIRNGQYSFIQNGTRSGGGTVNGSSSFNFDNGWQSVALVHRNTTIQIYKNGEAGFDNPNNVISSNWPTTKDMYLCYDNITNTPGIGVLLFYNRALSTSEIQVIHNNLKGRYGL